MSLTNITPEVVATGTLTIEPTSQLTFRGKTPAGTSVEFSGVFFGPPLLKKVFDTNAKITTDGTPLHEIGGEHSFKGILAPELVEIIILERGSGLAIRASSDVPYSVVVYGRGKGCLGLCSQQTSFEAARQLAYY